MRPLLFDLPLPFGLHLPVGAYGTLLVLGMLAATWVSGRHGRSLGLRRLDTFDLGLWLLAAGAVGAHLLHVAVYRDVYFAGGALSGLRRVATLWNGGLVFYGGVAAALPVLWLWGRGRGIPVLDLLDFVAPLGALGLALTRFGCFLNGCCFGAPSDLPWAVRFPPGSLPQQAQAALGLVGGRDPSLPVHPVQLYELGFALGLYALLTRLFPRRRFAGEGVVAFGLLYGLWRFAIEGLRADAPGWRPGAHSLTPYQWQSLALIGVAAVGWWAARRAARPAWSVTGPPPAAAGPGS
jgi:phosphatidylglycerol---prolipoprotein diacylglyceryl transferase